MICAIWHDSSMYYQRIHTHVLTTNTYIRTFHIYRLSLYICFYLECVELYANLSIIWSSDIKCSFVDLSIYEPVIGKTHTTTQCLLSTKYFTHHCNVCMIYICIYFLLDMAQWCIEMVPSVHISFYDRQNVHGSHGNGIPSSFMVRRCTAYMRKVFNIHFHSTRWSFMNEILPLRIGPWTLYVGPEWTGELSSLQMSPGTA